MQLMVRYLLLTLLFACHTLCAYSPSQLFVGVDCDAQGRSSTTGSPWGSLWGIAGSYDYIRNCHIYVGGQASWTTGNQHNGTKHNIKDLDLQGRWGYTCFCRCLFFSPYVGIGWRELTDQFKGAVENTFTYKKWYFPFGLRAGWLLAPCLEAGMDLQFRIDVHPFVVTGSPTVRSAMDKEWGFWLQLPLTWFVEPCNRCGWQVRLAPYAKWDKFGAPAYGPTTAAFKEWDGGVLVQLGWRI